jgi:hypothetical protein
LREKRGLKLKLPNAPFAGEGRKSTEQLSDRKTQDQSVKRENEAETVHPPPPKIPGFSVPRMFQLF